VVNDENNYSSEQHTDGKINGAFAFDGTNDYVTVANHTDLNFGSGEAFTICFWMKTAASQTQTYPGLVTKRHYADSPHFGFRSFMYSDGGVNDGKIKIEINTATENKFLLHNVVVDNQSWHFVVWGRKTNGTLFMYVDGGSYETVPGLSGDLTAPDDLGIGVRAGMLYPFEGDLDAVMLFGKELTEEEVAWLYNKGRGKENTIISRHAMEKY